jgi:hypothetical protein
MGRRWRSIAAGLGGCAILAWVLSFALTGVAGTRVANPAARVPLPVLRWAGLSVDHFWIPAFYGVTGAVMIVMVSLFYRHWRRTGRMHPGLPIFVVLFIQILGDPLYNWAMYCNYYPNLLHWPVNWSVMNVAPTVEPLWIVMGAYQVFFLAPALGIFALHRRFVLGRAKDRAWVRRHPVGSLFIFAWVLGGGMDILMEQWMLNMKIYKYTQIAGPSLGWGKGHLQVFEIIWIGALIAICAILLHRDDTGRSLSLLLAGSLPLLRRLRLRELGVAFVIVSGSLALYGCFWGALRLTGHATHVVPGAWPYPAARVYDPDGRMKAAGFPGPYFAGTWCTGSRCN